jgi:hypothetical protein
MKVSARKQNGSRALPLGIGIEIRPHRHGSVATGGDGVTEPPRGGVRHQDQLERFSVKREHSQHT